MAWVNIFNDRKKTNKKMKKQTHSQTRCHKVKYLFFYNFMSNKLSWRPIHKNKKNVLREMPCCCELGRFRKVNGACVSSQSTWHIGFMGYRGGHTGVYTALTGGSPLGGICQSISPQSQTHSVSVGQCVYGWEWEKTEGKWQCFL